MLDHPLVTTSPDTDRRVAFTIALLRQNLACTSLSLGVVCRRTNLSRSHLMRLFKRETGTTVRHFMMQLRVHRAQELLATTFLSIKQVAAAAGFKHVSELDRQFRIGLGVSPGEYRRYRHVPVPHLVAAAASAAAAPAPTVNE
jgi:transcriptional regulator GlxA family with amidase domain